MKEDAETLLPAVVSRRAFLGFLLAGLFALAIWAFRRMDLETAIQKYFGFQQDHRSMIRRRFQYLSKRNPVLYRDSIFFFGFFAFRAEKVLHKKLRNRVLENWIFYLFSHRSLSWPYIQYPTVNDFQICNGLIR